MESDRFNIGSDCECKQEPKREVAAVENFRLSPIAPEKQKLRSDAGRHYGLKNFLAQGMIFLLAVSFLSSCSATKRLASSAYAVDQNASAIQERANFIIGETDQATVKGAAQDISDRAGKITVDAGTIIKTIPEVKDITPAWVTMVIWVCIAIAIVAAIYFLSATGILPMIGAALMSIRAVVGWIPKRIANEAAMLHKAIDPANPLTIEEYTAAKRADPKFNAAFELAEKKAAESEKTVSATPAQPTNQIAPTQE